MNNAVLKMALSDYKRKQEDDLFEFVKSVIDGTRIRSDVWMSITYCVDLWREADVALREFEDEK